MLGKRVRQGSSTHASQHVSRPGFRDGKDVYPDRNHFKSKAFLAVFRLSTGSKPGYSRVETSLLPNAPHNAIANVLSPSRQGWDRIPKPTAVLVGAFAWPGVAARGKAADELERLWLPVLGVIREALARKPTLEVSRRLRRLIEKALRAHLAPDKLRALRRYCSWSGSVRRPPETSCEDLLAVRQRPASPRTPLPRSGGDHNRLLFWAPDTRHSGRLLP